MNCTLARCTQRARKSGFTLVELMVAIVILTIGMLGLAGTTAVMAQMVGTGARQTLAANVAQSRFEIMRRTSCATLTAGSGTTRGISEAWQVDSIRGGGT